MREITKIFKALSDPNRVKIIKMLGNHPLCVCEFPSLLNISMSTVSKHLSILRDAGFINDKKNGKWVIYSLNNDTTHLYVHQLLPLITTWLNDNEEIKYIKEKVKEIEIKNCIT